MPISAQFTADFSQFTAAAAGAQASLEGVKISAEDVSTGIDQQARQAGRALGAFTGEVVGFAKEYVSAFAEEEAATARLGTALKNAGTASAETEKAYADMATQFQNTTRFSDDAITAAQTALTQIGRIAPEQMEPAIKAATDLAASLGIGLEEAATKIATVIGSDGAKLGTLKGHLGDVELKGKGAADILGVFNSKFGGAAAADMATTEGKLLALNNKFDDFKGKVGEALATALIPMLDAFLKLSPGVQTVVAGVGALAVALVPIGIAFGTVMTAVGPLIAAMGGMGAIVAGVGTALAALAAPIAIAVVAIGSVYLAFKYWDQITAFVKSVYDGVKYWLVDQFTALVDLVMAPIKAVYGGFKWLNDQLVGHSVVPEMMEKIGGHFSNLQNTMVKPAEDATAQVLNAFNRMSHNLVMLETDSGGVAHDLFGRVVTPGGAHGLPKTMGQQNIQITVNGSVLSTEDQLAAVIGNGLSNAFSRGGQRLPA